jgi:ankyrin repeat protein
MEERLRERRAWQSFMAAVRVGTVSPDANWAPLCTGGGTALHFAAKMCSVAGMKELLDLGALPAVTDDNGFLPMHYAASTIHDPVKKCELLPLKHLAAGAETKIGTPLHLVAFRMRHHDIVRVCMMDVLQWMVNQPECAVDAVNKEGRTALDILDDMAETAAARGVLRAAMEQQARWSLLRTAWTATVAIAALST